MNRLLASLFALLTSASCALAWDYEGHRQINQLAVDFLAPDFPAFARTPEARERIGFLGGEADRWRNSTNHAAKHCASPEHYIDLDELPLYGLRRSDYTPFRYDFAAALAEGRKRHATNFIHVDLSRDNEHTRLLIGFLPWAINDHFARVESGFAYLREFDAAGTREEVAQARQNIIYMMGVMGHFVGDAAQPLHTTKHFNGWIGANPNGYRTNRSIHSWIDGGFIRQSGLTAADVRRYMRPARALWNASQTNIFSEALKFIEDQNRLVEKVYILDRDGALSPRNERANEGKEFIAKQMAAGAQLLADLWYSAWRNAPTDKFLKDELAARRQREAARP